jgi:hypothetical protein
MRPPRLRLWTLLLLVAASALVMGMGTEFARYRKWSRIDWFEQNARETAAMLDEIAKKERAEGDVRAADHAVGRAAAERLNADDYARMKAPHERAWHRFLGDRGVRP